MTKRRIPAGMLFRASVASVVALLLLVGCGSDEEASPGDTTPATTTEPVPTATVPDKAPAIVTVYFLRDGKVGAASRGVVTGPQIGRAAMMELLEGPATRSSGRARDGDSRRHASSKSLDLDGLAEVEAVGASTDGRRWWPRSSTR